MGIQSAERGIASQCRQKLKVSRLDPIVDRTCAYDGHVPERNDRSAKAFPDATLKGYDETVHGLFARPKEMTPGLTLKRRLILLGTITMPAGAPNQRFQAALERLGGDIELLQTMACIVVEDCPELQHQLAVSVAQGDMPSVAAISHKLKGLLSTFETNAPTTLLNAMEASAHKNDRFEVQQLHIRSQPEVATLIVQIAELT